MNEECDYDKPYLVIKRKTKTSHFRDSSKMLLIYIVTQKTQCHKLYNYKKIISFLFLLFMIGRQHYISHNTFIVDLCEVNDIS